MTSQGRAIREELYTIVFLIAVVIFFVVRGADRLDRPALPAQARQSPQTHGNAIAEVVWTVVPTLIVAFLFVVSWRTLNTVEAVSGEPETRIRAVADAFSGRSITSMSPATTSSTRSSCPPARAAAWSYRRAGQSCSTWRAQTSSTPSTCPSSCSSGMWCRGRVNTFEFVVDEDQASQVFMASTPTVRLRAPGHALRRPRQTPADFDAWLAAKIEAANASPTPAPSRPPPASGEPAPPAGDSPTVTVSAFNIAFEQAELTVPADTPFKIAFENKDPNIPHNVEIKDGGGASIYKGEIFNGVATQTYDVPALAAGAYPFNCTVHPNMTGTLTAN